MLQGVSRLKNLTILIDFYLLKGSRDMTLLRFSIVNLESSEQKLTFIVLYC